MTNLERIRTMSSKELIRLVPETMSKDEVNSLYAQVRELGSNVRAYAGTYTAWDGTKFDGYIVINTDPESHEEEYFFMETTLHEVDQMCRSQRVYEVEYSKLIPISAPTTFRSITSFENLIFNNCIDNWEFKYFPMTKIELDSRDWFEDKTTTIRQWGEVKETGKVYQIHQLSQEELKKNEAIKKKFEEDVLAQCRGTLPPAEDDFWYDILSMGIGTEGYDLEWEAIKILRKRGLHVEIDGEYDSCGWLTRGIFVEGKLMAMH